MPFSQKYQNKLPNSRVTCSTCGSSSGYPCPSSRYHVSSPTAASLSRSQSSVRTSGPLQKHRCVRSPIPLPHTFSNLSLTDTGTLRLFSPWRRPLSRSHLADPFCCSYVTEHDCRRDMTKQKRSCCRSMGGNGIIQYAGKVRELSENEAANKRIE